MDAKAATEFLDAPVKDWGSFLDEPEQAVEAPIRPVNASEPIAPTQDTPEMDMAPVALTDEQYQQALNTSTGERPQEMLRSGTLTPTAEQQNVISQDKPVTQTEPASQSESPVTFSDFIETPQILESRIVQNPFSLGVLSGAAQVFPRAGAAISEIYSSLLDPVLPESVEKFMGKYSPDVQRAAAQANRKIANQFSRDLSTVTNGSFTGKLTESVTTGGLEALLDVGLTGGAGTGAKVLKASEAGMSAFRQNILSPVLQRMAALGAIRSAGATSGQATDQRIAEGMAPEEAQQASQREGILSGLSTYLTTVLGGFTGVERILKTQGVEGFKRTASQVIKELPKTLLKEGVKESTQEMTDQALADQIERFERNPDKTLNDSIKEITFAGLTAFLVSSGVNTVDGVVSALEAMQSRRSSPLEPDPNPEVNIQEQQILAQANQLLKPSEEYNFGFEVVEKLEKDPFAGIPIGPVKQTSTELEGVLTPEEGQDSGEAIKTPVVEESETITPQGNQIVSTALRFKDKVVEGEGIQAHADLTPKALEQFIDDPDFNPDQIEYGFIDSEGNFKTRSEAEPIAVNAGQVREGYNPEGNLQSQDLLNTPVKPSTIPVEALQPQKATQTQPEQQEPLESPTGIKNAQIEKERAAKGLPPRIAPLRKTFGKSWDEAMAKVDKNPTAGTDLVESVLKEPRATNDTENALLLHEKVVRETVFNNAVDKVNNAVDDTERSEALAEMEQALNKVNEVNSAADVTGTLTARGLSSRRMMVNDDFTLARMVSETQAIVNQGKPLSPKQFEEVQELHRKLEEANKKIEELESNTSETGAKETIDQLLKEFRKGVQATRKTKEGRKLLFEERYQKAAERRRKSLGQLNVGIDPLALVDYAVIGAYYIEKGARNLADFTTRLVKDFGESVRQYAGDIYSKAQEVHADTDKLFTTQKEELTPDQIAAQHEEGTPLEGKVVHDLAKHYINNGVEGFENVMKAVQKDLKAVDESLTPRDINDALSGYGKVRYPSKEKDLATLREYKALARLNSQLEDAEKKLVPKKTGYQRDKASAEVRELQKRVSDTMKKLGIETRDPETQLASSQQAAKTRLRNEIEELDLAIKNKSKIAREKGVVKLDAEGEALKAQRDKKKAEYDALFAEPKKSPEEIALDNAIKAAEKSISRYDEMLKSGNLTPEQRKAKFTPTGELETLQSLREAMAKAVAELRKAQAPRTPPEETARKNAIKALDKSIAEYDKKLKEGDFSSKPTKPGKTAGMDDVQTKRSERDALRKLFEELKRAQVPKRDPAVVRLQARKKAIQTEINKLEQKIKDNDYVIPQKRDPLSDDELIKLQFEREKVREEYLKGLFEAQLKQRGAAKKVFDTAAEISGTARALMTGAEMSAVLRQGGWYMMGHPVKGIKAMGPMFKAFASEANQYKTDQEIRNNPFYPLAKQSKLFLSDFGTMDLRKMEENYMSRFSKRIPIIAGSQRAYSTYLNKIRMDQFESLVKSLGQDGKVTKDQARAIAAYVNVSTGRGDLKAMEKAMVGMNMAFFAPSYTLSRFQLLLGYPIWRGITGKEKAGGKVRALIAKEYARSLIGLSIFYSMAAAASDAFDWDLDFESDPRSPNFGKIRIGDTRLDPMMGLSQTSRILAQVFSGTKKTGSGKVLPLRDSLTYGTDAKVKYGGDDVFDVLSRFARTKAAPIPGSAINLLTGKNVVGEKSTLAGEAINLGVPLTWRDIYEAAQSEGVKTTAPSVLAFLGMGMTTYPDKKKKD